MKQTSAYSIGVIISTYNNPAWLENSSGANFFKHILRMKLSLPTMVPKKTPAG